MSPTARLLLLPKSMALDRVTSERWTIRPKPAENRSCSSTEAARVRSINADSPRTDADNAVTHTGEPVPPPVLAAGGLGLGALGLLALCAVGVLPWTTSTLRLDYGGLTVPWWTAALALGGVSGAVAYASGILAVRRLGPRLAAFLALIEVLIATATAALVLGQALAPIQWIGAVVVIVGIIIIRRTQ